MNITLAYSAEIIIFLWSLRMFVGLQFKAFVVFLYVHNKVHGLKICNLVHATTGYRHVPGL